MRHIILFLVAVSSVCLYPVRAANWLTDLAAARQRQAAENKGILILFTGSDWCPACKQLKADVLSKPEFGSFADANLILVEADFPRNKALPPQQKQANANLAKTYGVKAYPTMVLLDSRGEEFVRPSYAEDGVRSFVSMMENHVRNISVAAGRQPAKGPGEQATTVAPAVAGPPPPLFNGAPTAPPPRYTELTLKNISGPRKHRFALINNQTFAPGDSAKVRMRGNDVVVRCIEIKDSSVVVSVDGQPGQQELRLAGTQ
jgi:thioredoxin-related protein